MAVALTPNTAVVSRLRSEYVPEGWIWSSLGHYHRDRAHLLLRNKRQGLTPQQRMLSWLRDHLHPEIPRWYYHAVLGHDLHVSTWAELYVRVHHPDSPDPFFPRVQGWTEDLGRVSSGKVTTAFRDFESLNLVTDSPTYGDFKFHDVGLGTTAEANTQTGLITPTGITRVAGNQTNPTPSTYQTVAITTADTIEVWSEHGLFNAATGGVMLDRSLLTPTISVQPGDTVEWTYVLTKSAEP